MSSQKRSLNAKSKEALTDLLNDLQPVIDRHVSKLDQETIKFILTNYGKSLKLDLRRDFEVAKKNISSNPFDDLMNDLQDMDK